MVCLYYARCTVKITHAVMKRRSFIKIGVFGSVALSLPGCMSDGKTHIITLSFDDGMKKSFYKIAEIFEDNNLNACLNVIASAHLPSFVPPNEYHHDERGDFNDWNLLKARGHEIMPHSWDHSNLTEMPLEKAKEDIIKCLDYFEQNLKGFKTSEAVYSFAYNASTPELEQFALTLVRGIRTGGNSPVNPVPHSPSRARFACASFGPDNADSWVESQINGFLSSSGGWLVLNLHGLDAEGWGPLSSEYLDKLLKRLTELRHVEVLPAAEVLKRSTRQN